MSSKSDIQKMLLRLIEGTKQISGKEINVTEATDTYLAELGDIPADLLDAACSMYVSSGTWFPTPGQIRIEANKLKMTVLRVPSGLQAWAQVLSAVQHRESTCCAEGMKLYQEIDGKAGGEYGLACKAYYNHKDDCCLCVDGGYVEVYDHPAVKETVRLFGGRNALFTEYLVADRARFIDAYKEVLERETYLITMPEEVKGYLDTKTEGKQIEARSEIKSLSERMSK